MSPPEANKLVVYLNSQYILYPFYKWQHYDHVKTAVWTEQLSQFALKLAYSVYIRWFTTVQRHTALQFHCPIQYGTCLSKYVELLYSNITWVSNPIYIQSYSLVARKKQVISKYLATAEEVISHPTWVILSGESESITSTQQWVKFSEEVINDSFYLPLRRWMGGVVLWWLILVNGCIPNGIQLPLQYITFDQSTMGIVCYLGCRHNTQWFSGYLVKHVKQMQATH